MRSRLVLPLAAAALVVALVATIFAVVSGQPGLTAGTASGSTLVPLPARTSSAQPVVADAVFTGRTSDNALTLAVGVRGGRATAYLCDGKSVEAWLEGDVTGTHVVLRGHDPRTTIDATVNGTSLFGNITLGGPELLPFSAQAATGPGGLYQIRRSVQGIADRIGWIVLADGTQVGIRNRDGVRTPAPPLDPDTTTSQVDGESLHPDRVSGSTVVLGP